ncbi:MAG: FTR1 family iron permease [Propionibacteriaceae bacterium]|jgi:high-affinity iron transporter|nr:FTR1 family iron permease [Propionibacteriaceae bacterium]
MFGCLLGLASVTTPAHADANTWDEVVDTMAEVASAADTQYQAGENQQAWDTVNSLYYDYYEKLGMEKTVNGYISGDRGAEVEYQFGEIKREISAGVPAAQVSGSIAKLVEMLREDAGKLDNKQEVPFASFFMSLGTILREGMEAILVVSAVIAYLVKSGNKRGLAPVYAGVVAALLGSIALALLFNFVWANSGASQEFLEGATALVACVLLVWVGNWMFSKSAGHGWTNYLRSQISGDKGVFSLALVAFLAVLREGAETIIFYAGQFSMATKAAQINQIWWGLGIGAFILVGVFVAIRVFAVKIPLRPFFLITSALLAVLAFTFAGGGVKELQEGNILPITPLPGIGSLDILSIYPTAETLGAQILVVAVIVGLAAFGLNRNRRKAQQLAVSTPA